MEAFKEVLINPSSPFPVDIFIRENLIENISAEPHWHECYEILYVLTKINLEKASDMLNLSSSYFSRYFKRITGRTFKEYIDFVRACEVEKLILTTDMNISQAAYEAGFCNISSFNRIFKRVKGYPPGEIKKTKTAKD